MAWKEMGFLDDTPVEYLAKDSKAISWLELTAKVLHMDADET